MIIGKMSTMAGERIMKLKINQGEKKDFQFIHSVAKHISNLYILHESFAPLLIDFGFIHSTGE